MDICEIEKNFACEWLALIALEICDNRLVKNLSSPITNKNECDLTNTNASNLIRTPKLSMPIRE